VDGLLQSTRNNVFFQTKNIIIIIRRQQSGNGATRQFLDKAILEFANDWLCRLLNIIQGTIARVFLDWMLKQDIAIRRIDDNAGLFLMARKTQQAVVIFEIRRNFHYFFVISTRRHVVCACSMVGGGRNARRLWNGCHGSDPL
jgi:hypothetical protein